MRFMDHRVAKPIVEKMPHRPWRDHGTTFFGDDGWVSVDRGGCYLNLKGETVNAYKVELKSSDWRAYESNNQVHNWIDCMRTRRPTINPLESAIRSDTISHLSDIAIRTGRPLRWDPKTETIVDDPAASQRLDRPMREPYTM
jgi:hypothetical protein